MKTLYGIFLNKNLLFKSFKQSDILKYIKQNPNKKYTIAEKIIVGDYYWSQSLWLKTKIDGKKQRLYLGG